MPPKKLLHISENKQKKKDKHKYSKKSRIIGKGKEVEEDKVSEKKGNRRESQGFNRVKGKIGTEN